LRLTIRQLITASVVLVLVAGATTLAQSKTGQRALAHVGVGSAPTRYTELAFASPATIPSTLHRIPRSLHAAFTITNRERGVATYHWEITATDVRTRVLHTGDVYVGQGDRVYLNPMIKLGCSRRTRITVRLSSGQHIDFWADCGGR
jgi:hypothetical protein